MNNKKCPKCGAESFEFLDNSGAIGFDCNSIIKPDGTFFEQYDCLIRQRDQLITYLKRIVEAWRKTNEDKLQ